VTDLAYTTKSLTDYLNSCFAAIRDACLSRLPCTNAQSVTSYTEAYLPVFAYLADAYSEVSCEAPP
jgi:hypothetical protein